MSYSASSSSFHRNNHPKCNTVVPQSRPQSPHTASAHILDDYSILNVFHLYRPFILDRDEEDSGWAGENWWYKLAHVCQRWRNIILGSASYLGLCLYCTKGTPITDMLAHSPPLPLVIEHDYEDSNIAAGDEEGLMLSLEQRNRIRRIRLRMAIPNLQKFIMAIGDEFPILEYLMIVSPWQSIALVLPETLQAPRLRDLTLIGFVPPIRSRLLLTTGGLVILLLSMTHRSTWIHPNELLQCLSFMPQLEELVIGLLFPFRQHYVDQQLTHTPTMTSITLPNLRELSFEGVTAYMEALVQRITAPRIQLLDIKLSYQLMFSTPHLLQFIRRKENLSFDRARFRFFTNTACLTVSSREGPEIYRLSISIDCLDLDWQLYSIAQISNTLSQVFYTVERLAFVREAHASGQSSAEHSMARVDHADWKIILESFSNVKTLRIDYGLLEGFCRCLKLDNGEGFLPEIQELTYIGRSDADVSFAPFIKSRQNEGRPITLSRQSPTSTPNSSESSSEGPTTTTARGDGGNDTNT